MEKKPYYITTAIAYTSGKPHIGNTYEIVLADSIARFKRQEGYDVRFHKKDKNFGIEIFEPYCWLNAWISTTKGRFVYHVGFCIK